MEIYAHQKNIIDEDPHRCGLFMGTGSGKTRTALLLARGRTIVICPKTQMEDRNWQRELATIGNPNEIFLVVFSKEEFKSNFYELLEAGCDTLIVDEAHTCLGVTPNTRQRKKMKIPKTSQLFEALSEYADKLKPKRIYLCTATIMKSPMTVWGAAKVLGLDKGDIISFLTFREKFYVQLPMPGREIYVPRTDTQSKDALAKLVRNMGYVGRLDDFFDVPEQTFRTIYVELTAEQKAILPSLRLDYPDPLVFINKRHQVENGVLAGDEFSEGQSFSNNKLEHIENLATEFSRIVVFAKYRAQIEQIKTYLEARKFKVYTLTGSTKDRGALLKEANKATKAVFIAQAQVSAGWELPEYPCMVFASRTYSYVDYAQALGRIQRANNIKKNLYVNLVVRRGVDEAVDRSLMNKQDFDERIYAKEHV